MWPADVAVDRFELTLELSDANGNVTTAQQIVRPQLYEPRTPLRLPSDAALFVHAGHDLLAHHRRFPLHSALTERLGIAHNVTRYAYDFAVIDERGEMYRGDGTKRSDWYGFGTPVLAPAAGVVVETFNDQPDNDIGQPPRLEAKALVENPKRLFGNYILIDHGNGEFGLLAHLKQGSVEVRPGQRVTAGQKLGAIGMSGDASIVHLHFQMQSGRGFDEGVPSRFVEWRRRTGEGWASAQLNAPESGDVIRRAN